MVTHLKTLIDPASHQCGLGLSTGVDAICRLSLLLVLSLALRGFSPGTNYQKKKIQFSSYISLIRTYNKLYDFSFSWNCGMITLIIQFFSDFPPSQWKSKQKEIHEQGSKI